MATQTDITSRFAGAISNTTQAPAMRSVEASRLIWQHAPVKGNELLVLQCLASFANANFECHPSAETIAKMTKLSRRHIRRVLHSLRSKNLITFDHNPGGKGKTHHFRLLVNGDTTNGDNGDISHNGNGDISGTQTVTNFAQTVTNPHANGVTAMSPEGFKGFKGK